LILICGAAFGTDQALAQSGGLIASVKWGKSLHNVQLSITLTNDNFKVHSPTIVTALTRNSGTNAVEMEVAFPAANFDLLLESATGRVYHVVTPTLARGMLQFVTVNSREERTETIPVTFGEEIEPGNYTLKTIRFLGFKDEQFKVVSNVIKVKITH